MAYSSLPIEERFWNKVRKLGPDDCWSWSGNKNNKGYGLFYAPDIHGVKRKQLAHRVSYIWHHAPIPDSLCVLHSCDNPPCINPAHLFAGTKKDNSQDCMAKGRHRYKTNGSIPPIFRGDSHWARRRPDLVLRGEQIGTSKMTEADVLIIWRLRLAGKSYGSIANAVKLDRSTVADICRGKRWGHLLGSKGAPTLDELLALPNSRPSTKLIASDIPLVRDLIAGGENNHQIADRFGVHHATISDIRRNVTWRSIP